MKINRQIILASKSPRRKELLESIGLPFAIHESDFEEIEGSEAPEKLALHNAAGKAREVAGHYDDTLVIGVDTVVALDHHLLGKPKDPADARRILELLSGSTHQVISAITIVDTKSKKTLSAHEETQVTMDRLSDREITDYINSGEGADKAAGYAIQGLGALYISKISGDYFNVVGLPLYRLRKMLEQFDLKMEL